MAYTLPSATGWDGYTYVTMSVYVEQVYDAVQNKSTLTIKLQGRLPTALTYSDTFSLWGLNGTSGTLKCNGSTLVTFPSSGQSKYTVYVNADQQWRVAKYDGADMSWAVTVNHNPDGTASVPFVLDAFAQSQSNNATYNTTFSNKSTTLSLSNTPQSGGTVWIYDNGWQECQPYVYDNGWQKCDAYIYDNGWVKA